MNSDGNEDFYLSVQLVDVEKKVWFDDVKQISRIMKLSEDVLNVLKLKVKVDMPTLEDYLKKENKEKIRRTIVEGVSDWKKLMKSFTKSRLIITKLLSRKNW
jgi:ribosomal protein L19E